MHLLFVKLHLIIFEVVSLILFVAIFVALFYYSLIFSNFESIQEEANIGSMKIFYSAKYSEGVFADIDMYLYPIDTEPGDLPLEYGQAYILYSLSYYEGLNETEIIRDMNDSYPNNIFLFENYTIAENFKHRLMNLKTECSTFNLTLFLLISLFLIFTKVSLLKDSFLRLKKIKSSKSDGKNEVYTNLLHQINPEEYSLAEGETPERQTTNKSVYYSPVLSFLNPINVYYYVIFQLTVAIIIPSIFPNYIEYYVISYFGFMSNMTYSVYYARSLFGLTFLRKRDEYIDLERMMIPTILRKDDITRKLFLLHEPLDLAYYTPGNINPYMKNLLVMCGCIWLSQLFHPFNKQQTVKIVDVDLKKGKLKRLIKVLSICGVFAVWGFLIFSGMIFICDNLYLYHRLLIMNFKRIFDLKIPILIGLFYYHIYFYVIMIIYTYQVHYKNKRYEGNLRIEYNWFS